MKLRIALVIAVLTAFGCATAKPVPDAADAPLPPFPVFSSLVTGEQSVLFVGNSYTAFNDLPAVYGVVREDARIEAVALPAYTLSQHAKDATTDGTELSRWLRTGAADDTRWDAVILQDQSQLPAFGLDNPSYAQSREAAATLGQLASAKGAAVVLYVTWGRKAGDELGHHPDFSSMERLLEQGYRGYAERLKQAGVRVRLAPVGPAFARVHKLAAASGDPTAKGSLFDSLYDEDGSHPTQRGTYLAACVIASTITGADPATFGTPRWLSEEEAKWVRMIAREVMMDPAWTPQ